jgi:hypothetical protein
MIVLWMPFDLLSLAASSQPALKAERARLISTLEALRTSLASAISRPPNAETESSKGKFSNAASDLFCQAKLLVASPDNSYARIENMAAQVETVLLMLQRQVLNTQEANRLLNVLDVEIARLQ